MSEDNKEYGYQVGLNLYGLLLCGIHRKQGRAGLEAAIKSKSIPRSIKAQRWHCSLWRRAAARGYRVYGHHADWWVLKEPRHGARG